VPHRPEAGQQAALLLLLVWLLVVYGHALLLLLLAVLHSQLKCGHDAKAGQLQTNSRQEAQVQSARAKQSSIDRN
jgi:hypothetical protein